jgi:hypothetical protein
MSLPFIKKDRSGFYIEFSKSLYPRKAMDRLRADCPSGDLLVSEKGACFILRARDGAEDGLLEALNYILYFSRNN